MPGVNIGDAIAAAAREGVVLSGGGHAMAGGLSLEPGQVEAFDRWMCAHMDQFKRETKAAKVLEVDAVLGLGGVSLDLFDAVAGLGPFGTGSPEPVFALADVMVTGLRAVGAGGHVRFTAEDGAARLDGIAWRVAGSPLGDLLRSGERVHLAGRLKADAWNGKRRLQLELIDAAPA